MDHSFWPTIIMLLAIALMCMEIFIPSGGVLTVLAAIAFLASIIVAFMNGGVALGALFMTVACGVIPLVLFLFVKFWPRTAIGRRILIEPPSEKELISEEAQSLKDFIGQQGTTVTPMLPSGAIRLNRQTIDAVSDGMTIEKGMLVTVVAARGNHLVVRPVTSKSAEDENNRGPQPLDSFVPDPFDDPLA